MLRLAGLAMGVEFFGDGADVLAQRLGRVGEGEGVEDVTISGLAEVIADPTSPGLQFQRSVPAPAARRDDKRHPIPRQ